MTQVDASLRQGDDARAKFFRFKDENFSKHHRAFFELMTKNPRALDLNRNPEFQAVTSHLCVLYHVFTALDRNHYDEYALAVGKECLMRAGYHIQKLLCSLNDEQAIPSV